MNNPKENLEVVIKLLIGILSGLTLLVLLSIGAFWLFLSTTVDEMCGNRILSRQVIEGRMRDIIVFQRDCGATTGFSTHVSIILRNKELPNDSGNLFSADSNRGKTPKGLGGGPEVSIEVISEDQIIIRHHPNARVYKKLTDLDGMRVDYSSL